MEEEKLEEYRKVCREIAQLARNAEMFACSGSAASSIDSIVAYARKAHVISGHLMGFGPTFMDHRDANVFRFKEPVQLEGSKQVAMVRGRNSPFMPALKEGSAG